MHFRKRYHLGACNRRKNARGARQFNALTDRTINRVSSESDIVFNGTMANNSRMTEYIAEKMARSVSIFENPQFIGTFGAALLASVLET